jgi:Protein of unknown function (DUF2917)
MTTPTSMTKTHQTPSLPWQWPLRGARRLPAADDGRWLLVADGNAWLTRSEGAEGLSDDIWLAAGQRQWLPAGSEWVIEGWPAAQLELVLAPPGAAAVSAAGGAWRTLRQGWRRVLQPLRRVPRQPSKPAFA